VLRTATGPVRQAASWAGRQAGKTGKARTHQVQCLMGIRKTSGEPTRTFRHAYTVFSNGLLGIWHLRITLNGGNGVPIGTAYLGNPGTGRAPCPPLRLNHHWISGREHRSLLHLGWQTAHPPPRLCMYRSTHHSTCPGTYLPRPLSLLSLPSCPVRPCCGIHTQRPTLVTHSCPPPGSFPKPTPSLRLRGGTNPSWPLHHPLPTPTATIQNIITTRSCSKRPAVSPLRPRLVGLCLT
jgi:hypothetical protein